MRVIVTNPNFFKQTLILPFVGQVTFDDKGGFDCPDELVEQLVSASSVPLTTETQLKSTKNNLVQGGTKNVIVDRPKKLSAVEKKAAQKAIDDAEKEAEKQQLIDAITEADAAELQDLVQLVPGVDPTTVPTVEESLREFLLSKVR
jgi:ribosomal protein S12 methylthiotransferase accessory factor YcaO